MTTVDIVAVGNELLLGDVLDTNTHWLCKRITGLGGRVRRAVMIEDDVEVIAAEIRGALARGADVVFTTGGLGPTADDMTLTAVAQALDAPLELNEEALSLVLDKEVTVAFATDDSTTAKTMLNNNTPDSVIARSPISLRRFLILQPSPSFINRPAFASRIGDRFQIIMMRSLSN